MGSNGIIAGIDLNQYLAIINIDSTSMIWIQAILMWKQLRFTPRFFSGTLPASELARRQACQ